MVGCRGVGEGRPGDGPGRRRVDDLRLPPGDRRARRRHRPVLRPGAQRRTHLEPCRGALQQDVRHRAPGRAVGDRRNLQVSPLFEPPGSPRRVLLPGSDVGAPAVVRVERRPRRALRRRRARGRVGQPLVEPDHGRRAPQHARERRARRPLGVPDLRARRARARRVRRLPLRQQDRPGRPGDLHAMAHARRRLPLRPHDAPRRRRHGERRDRRVRRRPRPGVDQEVHAQGRLGHRDRRTLRRSRRSACGGRTRRRARRS